MLGTAIIVFREVLEAALIVSIVMAAAKGIAQRGFYVAMGVIGGCLGAALLAVFAGELAEAAEGMGQELFNAAVLFAAVIMLAAHNAWMAAHVRELGQKLNKITSDVRSGSAGLPMLAMVVGAAVLREGAETVLFLFGIASGDHSGAGSLLLGGLIGMAGGIVCGITLYFGLVRIPTKRLFAVTGWLIMLLAAGMAASGAGFLIQIGWLPPLVNQMWDTSFILSRDSIAGRALHALIGYDDRPSGIQVLFYLGTLAGMIILARLAANNPPAKSLRA
jgi:high-affinity iron transporter